MVLAVSLFRVGVGQDCDGASSLIVSCWVSRAQPVHASANKLRQKLAEWGRKRSLRRWSLRGQQSAVNALQHSGSKGKETE